MDKQDKPPWFEFVIRLIVGLVLAFSGFAHLQNPFLFLDSLLAYDIIDGKLAWSTAVLLPFLEIGLAVLWFSNLRVKSAALPTIVMFGAFLLAQLSVIIRGITIDCGCFGGVIKREVGFGSVFFLVLLVLATLFACYASRIRFPPHNQPRAQP